MKFGDIKKRVELGNINSINKSIFTDLYNRYHEKKNDLLFESFKCGANDDKLITQLYNYTQGNHSSADYVNKLITTLDQCEKDTWLTDCIVQLLNKSLNVNIQTQKIISGHNGGTLIDKYPSELAREFKSHLLDKSNPQLFIFKQDNESNNDPYYSNNAIFEL
ncbi:hypothetical protein L3V83_06580 [Thiotrichales bacterium 19X7-9]|nr:hypothetical protein [Thiotrichales bacterium 19X7-9]